MIATIRLTDGTELRPTLSAIEVAELWGCSADHVWEMSRDGQAPVEPLRLGRKLRWPTLAVLRSVGIETAS